MVQVPVRLAGAGAQTWTCAVPVALPPDPLAVRVKAVLPETRGHAPARRRGDLPDTGRDADTLCSGDRPAEIDDSPVADHHGRRGDEGLDDGARIQQDIGHPFPGTLEGAPAPSRE